MIIRKATKEDLPSLTILFEAYRVWYKQTADKEAALQFLMERMENNESVVFIALDDAQEMLGFTQLYPIFSSTRMQKLWLLNDLFVVEKHRGKGISKAIMSKAQEFAKKTHSVGLILETDKDNVVGNQLYPRMGFELDKTNHYNWEIKL